MTQPSNRNDLVERKRKNVQDETCTLSKKLKTEPTSEGETVEDVNPLDDFATEVKENNYTIHDIMADDSEDSMDPNDEETEIIEEPDNNTYKKPPINFQNLVCIPIIHEDHPVYSTEIIDFVHRVFPYFNGTSKTKEALVIKTTLNNFQNIFVKTYDEETREYSWIMIDDIEFVALEPLVTKLKLFTEYQTCGDWMTHPNYFDKAYNSIIEKYFS